MGLRDAVAGIIGDEVRKFPIRWAGKTEQIAFRQIPGDEGRACKLALPDGLSEEMIGLHVMGRFVGLSMLGQDGRLAIGVADFSAQPSEERDRLMSEAAAEFIALPNEMQVQLWSAAAIVNGLDVASRGADVGERKKKA